MSFSVGRALVEAHHGAASLRRLAVKGPPEANNRQHGPFIGGWLLASANIPLGEHRGAPVSTQALPLA